MAIGNIINNINVGRSAVGSAVNLLSGLLGESTNGGQAKFSVNNLNAAMQKGNGLVQPTLFLAELTSPPFMNGDSRPQNFLCNSANLPGKNIIVQEHKRYGYGPPDRRVTGATFPEITLTFFVSNDGEPLQYFNQWLENIFYTNGSKGGNAESPYGVPAFNVRYRDQYTIDFEISVFDVAHEKIIKYKLFEAFPMQIGDVTVEWGANDSFATVAVVFTYRYYEMNSVMRPAATSSSGGFLSGIRNGLGVVNRIMTSSPARNVMDALNFASGQKLF